MLLERQKSQFLLIDMQERLLPAITGGERVVKNAGILLETCKVLKIPAAVSEQYRKGLGATVPALQGHIQDCPTFEKMHFSCAADEALLNHLTAIKDRGRGQIVLAGTEAHVCVAQTALELKHLNFEVFVAADAIASRTGENRNLALARFRCNGIEVVSTEMVLFEWLHVSGTGEFRSLSKLIK